MPLFEYHCPDCRNDFDELRALADRDQTAVCPKCKSRRPVRKISTFAAAGFDHGSASSCSSSSGFS